MSLNPVTTSIAYAFAAIALAVLVAGFCAKAYASTDQVSTAVADQFYHHCVAKRDLRMEYETQETFCKCSAHKLQQNITMEQLGNVASSDINKVTEAMDRLTLGVYAPCITYPVKDIVHDKCTENDFHADKGICGCLSKKMASYTSENATTSLMKTIQSKPGISDPLSTFMLSAKFRQYKKQAALECVQEVKG